MSLRKKILIGAGSFFLLLIAWAVAEHYFAKSRLAAYRKKLIAQGEKLTVAELVPQAPAGENGAPGFASAAAWLQLQNLEMEPSAMRRISNGVARVVWKEEEPFDIAKGGMMKTNYWSYFRQILESNRVHLATLQVEAQKPVFNFSIEYSQGYNTLLPHLAEVKSGVRWLAMSVLVDLHEGKPDDAFATLRAMLALLATYQDEPVIISQQVRAACAQIAFNATWEALQYDDWTEAQLAELQNGWRKIDFVSSIEPALAMERAWGVMAFSEARKKHPFDGANGPLAELLDGGRNIFVEPLETVRKLATRYPAYWAWIGWWSYDDEIAFYSDWQIVLEANRDAQRTRFFGQAVSKWEALPVTSNQRDQHRFLISRYLMGSPAFLRRTAGMQSRKEMMVAAIALRRYQIKNQKVASHLNELVPDFLSEVPIDYFTGQPLRYQQKGEDEFLLYSVGADLKDDGGNAGSNPMRVGGVYFGSDKESGKPFDLVWPRAATATEIRQFEKDRMAEMEQAKMPVPTPPEWADRYR